MFIRKTFFPRWDKEGQWIVKESENLPSQGLCDLKKKAIFLQYLPEKDNDLYEILIHEICHAVTDGGHGRKWLTRMLKASDIAKEIGYEQLSKLVHEQVEQYSDPEKYIRVGAREIYTLIEDWAFENPDLTYSKMIEAVAAHFGLYPKELEKAYKRCKIVYEKATKGEFVTSTWFRKEIIKEGDEIRKKSQNQHRTLP